MWQNAGLARFIPATAIDTDNLEALMTDTADHTGEDGGSAFANSFGDPFKFVCEDPAGGQSIAFTELGGRQVITYTDHASGKEVTLTDSEAASIIAWKNNARRNSFWNWPGWDAVLDRSDIGSRRKAQD